MTTTPRPWLDELTLQTVIVHLKGGSQSFKGVLEAVHSDCLVLRHVLALDADQRVLLDGEVVVPRSNVDFMQIVRGDE